MLSLSGFILSREGWMSSALLLIAPACLALIIGVTQAHLSRRRASSARPHAAAWLATPLREPSQRQGLQLRAPWLWLTRLSLLGLLLALPSSYQPWERLISSSISSSTEESRGSAVITSGPLELKPEWERPLWVMLASPTGAPPRWSDAEGRLHSSPVEIKVGPRLLELPQLSSPRRLARATEQVNTAAKAQRERHKAELFSSLQSAGLHPKRLIYVSPQSPRLRAALLSWGARHEEGLSLELALRDEEGAPPPLQVSLEVERGAGLWRALSSLEAHPVQRGIYKVQLPLAQITDAPWRACALFKEQRRECLPLTRPAWEIKVERARWPAGMQLIFDAIDGLKMSSRAEADWRLAHAAAQGSSAPAEAAPASRLIQLSSGGGPLSPVWGEALSEGSLGSVSKWRALSAITRAQLSALGLGALKSSPAQRLLYALEPQPERRVRQSLIADERLLWLEGARGAYSTALSRVAWEPALQAGRDPTLSLVMSWVQQHRSRLISCCPKAEAAQRSSSSPRQGLERSLIELIAPAHQPQRAQQLTLSQRDIERAQAAPRAPSPWLMWALLISASLLWLQRRSSDTALLTLCLGLWLISQAELSLKLGGLWRSPPRVSLNLSSSATGRGERASSLRERWREQLLLRGFDLSEFGPPPSVELYFGEPGELSAPDKPARAPVRWLIPTQPPPEPELRIGGLSAAWSADLEGLWLSAQITLNGGLSAGLEGQRYELSLTPARGERALMMSCLGLECLKHRAALHLLYPSSQRSKLNPAAQRVNVRLEQLIDRERLLIDERRWVLSPPQRRGQAWAWGQSGAWLKAAGYRSYAAPQHIEAELPVELEMVSIHDVPAEQLSAELVRRLERWVSAGGTLLLSGRERAFESGGWLGAPIERLSPFTSRAPLKDRARWLFLIDVSGSVSVEAGGLGVSALIERSLRLAAQLPAEDEVAFISFAGEAELILPPTPRRELSAVLAPQLGSGGSRLGAGLAEASRWLSDSGPQRLLLITDGELSSSGLMGPLKALESLSAQRDLSLQVALSDEAPLSAEATKTLKLLQSALPVQLRPLEELTRASLYRWRVAKQPSAPREAEERAQPARPLAVWLSASARGRLSAPLPAVQASAAVQLKPGATLLAELSEPQGRRPLLAEWRLGLGRVIALATDQWALPSSGWRALLAPSPERSERGRWRFSWRAEPLSVTARHVEGELLSGAGIMIGPDGERLSGRWRGALGGLSYLSAQDGGALDLRAQGLDWAELRAERPQGFLSAQLSPQLEPAQALTSSLGAMSELKERRLSHLEALKPSGSLFDELARQASRPAPLPPAPLSALIILLALLELLRWRRPSR